MQTTYYALIPGQDGRRILLVRQEHGYTLPHWVSADQDDPPLSALHARIQEQTGIPVTALRSIYERSEEGRRQIVYAMENRSLLDSPSPAAKRENRIAKLRSRTVEAPNVCSRARRSRGWGEGTLRIGPEELPGLEIVPPEHRAALEAWFAEAALPAPPALRNPWARPGWLDTASAWISDQLRNRGILPAGPVEPFRIGCLSAVLRVPTAAGYVYFKAAIALFAVEPQLTQWLSARYPGNTPSVLAIDTERVWMLLRAFGGTMLGETPELEAWEEALRLFARIQIESAAHLAELQAMDCPDRRLARLADQFESLLADRAMLQKIPNKGLSEDEITELESLAPSVRALSERLRACGVPDTLAHGDLQPWNIQVQDGIPLIYDWTDAALAHPFLDLLPFLRRRPKEEAPEVRIRLRDAYLDAWSAYGSPELLAEAFEMAQILASVYQALSYAAITANLETAEQHRVSNAVPGYLRRLLQDRNRLVEYLS